MTTTIGGQLRPYVSEKPKEEESVPCEGILTFYRKKNDPILSRPSDTTPFMDSNIVGRCNREATYTGICPVGDSSVNLCQECMDNHILDTNNHSAIHGGMIYAYTGSHCNHAPFRAWAWFPR